MIEITERADPSFALVNHERSMACLRATMARVGASMMPAEFIRVVSNAYHAVGLGSYIDHVQAMFRTSGSHEHFKRSLHVAREQLPARPSVLDLGCGAGYDLEVLQELFSPSDIGCVFCYDSSPDMLAVAKEKAGGYDCRFAVGGIQESLSHAPFDLVITHSLVHHIPNLGPFFSNLRAAVAPGGIYVMGHEPNRRYWRNSECLAVLADLERDHRRRKRIRKLLDPGRYVRKIGRLLGSPDQRNETYQINVLLQRELGFRSSLTPQEVSRLVDVHVPDRFEGDFSIGGDGFDREELQIQFLPDCELISFATWGYLGHHNPAHALPRWRDANARLAARFPFDGSNFAAVWRKRS